MGPLFTGERRRRKSRKRPRGRRILELDDRYSLREAFVEIEEELGTLAVMFGLASTPHGEADRHHFARPSPLPQTKLLVGMDDIQ